MFAGVCVLFAFLCLQWDICAAVDVCSGITVRSLMFTGGWLCPCMCLQANSCTTVAVFRRMVESLVEDCRRMAL